MPYHRLRHYLSEILAIRNIFPSVFFRLHQKGRPDPLVIRKIPVKYYKVPLPFNLEERVRRGVFIYNDHSYLNINKTGGNDKKLWRYVVAGTGWVELGNSTIRAFITSKPLRFGYFVNKSAYCRKKYYYIIQTCMIVIANVYLFVFK